MKLKTKIFQITDINDQEINIESKPVNVLCNGIKTPFGLPDVFTYSEFDDGEIYGNSLLSCFNVKEGKLCVQGSEVELRLADTNELIVIKAITRPGMHDDEMVSFDTIKQFAQDFNIQEPDNVFEDMNDDEKQFFIDARNTAKASMKQAEQAKSQEQKTTA